MSSKRISELTIKATFDNTDWIAIDEIGGTTKRVSKQTITPDATETIKGVIRIPTTIEAKTLDDTTAMTPLKTAQLRAYETVGEVVLTAAGEVEFADLDDGYSHMFLFENVKVATDDTWISMVISRDNGLSYITSANYQYILDSNNSDGTSDKVFINTSMDIPIVSFTTTWALSNAVGHGLQHAKVECPNPSDTNMYAIFGLEASYIDQDGVSVKMSGTGSALDALTAYNAIKFFPFSGNFVAGGKIKHIRY